jgi:excisionase family DNA binding protein
VDALSLGQASRLLGVDPDTLRRWSDQGKVKAYRTPGGHRRFDRASLERIRRSGGREQASLAGLGLTQTRMVARYRRTYRQPVAGRLDPKAMVGSVDHGAFREEGRSLTDALIRHLDAPGEPMRGQAWAEASDLARRHGSRMAHGRASLIDGVTLFVAARQPFLAEVGALARRRALDAQQLTRLYEEAMGVLDRLLLEFIDGYRTAG